MEALQSPLNIKDFSVFECEMKFISPENDDTKIVLNDLAIDIDYDYYAPKDDGQETRMIEMNLKVNPDRKKPGYSINLTVVGIFEVDDAENLEEEMVVNLFGISALNMMISHTRAFLISVTTYGPFGNYLLPAIDIGDLRKKEIRRVGNDCVRDKKREFVPQGDNKKPHGEIQNNEMNLSEIGFKANSFWLEIPEHFPFVKLDEFVVMPNHEPAIVIIDKPDDGQGNDMDDGRDAAE